MTGVDMLIDVAAKRGMSEDAMRRAFTSTAAVDPSFAALMRTEIPPDKEEDFRSTCETFAEIVLGASMEEKALMVAQLDRHYAEKTAGN